VTVLRFGVLVPAWMHYDKTSLAFRAAIDQLPAGSRILPAFTRPIEGGLFRSAFEGSIPYLHLTEIAVGDIGGFTPLFFSVPGQQPIKVRADVSHLSAGTGSPPSLRELLDTEAGAPPSIGRAYLTEWRRTFDHVALFENGGPDAQPQLPPGLELASRGPGFSIYRIQGRP
jgi:hypothetical protein